MDEIVKNLNEELVSDLPKIFNLESEDFENTRIKVYETDFEKFINKGESNFNSTFKQLNIRDKALQFTIKVTNSDEFYEITLSGVKNIFMPKEDNDMSNVSEGFINVAAFFVNKYIYSMNRVLYIPAERNGINVFRKELALNRSNKSFGVIDSENSVEKYPLPISDYMMYLNLIDLEVSEKYLDISPRKQIWDKFSLDILKGKYEYDSKIMDYFYREIYSVNSDNVKYRSKRIPLQIASSSTKSLFGMEYYLKYLYQKGDILFIDEPEMNLDPENQMKLAELLVDLSYLDVKLIISSHSDYLIRATTNKVLKSKLLNGESDNKIKGYYFSNTGVKDIGDLGEIEFLNIFDDVNEILEEEFFKLRDKLEKI